VTHTISKMVMELRPGPHGIEAEQHERVVSLSIGEVDDAHPTACRFRQSWVERVGGVFVQTCASGAMKRGSGRYPVCRSHMRLWLSMIGPIEAAREWGLYPEACSGSGLAYRIGKACLRPVTGTRTWADVEPEAMHVFADWLDSRGEQRALVVRLRGTAGRVLTRVASAQVEREAAGQQDLALGEAAS
jgi:hypothetical protein